MPAGPLPLATGITGLSHTATVVGLRLAAALAAFVAVAALLRVLTRRGAISRSLGGLVKWLCILGLIWGLEWSLPADLAGQAGRAFPLAGLLAAWMIARHGVDFLYSKLCPARGQGKPGRHILQDLTKFLILAVLIGWGLREILDIQLGPLLTSSAILTAVIGLSMQDTIGSLFSGLLLQIEKPFVEGDWIRVGDVEGKVTEVTWRYTKVVTLDANAVLLPNNVVAKERLVNYDRPESHLRQILTIPAPTDAPPVAVKSAILTALRRAEGVLRDPPPVARLQEIQPDRIIYTAVYYTAAFTTRLPAADAVLSTIWYQFMEHGIAIPAPMRQIVMTERASRDIPPDDLAALAGVPLLAGMAEPDLRMLMRASVSRTFSPGQTIMAKGETGTTMDIILSGLVGVYVGDRELARLSSGQIFGEMALLTGEPRQADVRVLEPTTCLIVDREGFRMVLTRHPVVVDRVRAIFESRAAANHQFSKPDATAEALTLFARFRNLFL
ncbi:cyclic nucleotide-binding domain-containing protein [Solidesulfovibrio sp.]